MKYQLNSYLAVLIITVVGSWATLILVRVVTSDALAFMPGDEAAYAPLQQSIVKPKP